MSLEGRRIEANSEESVGPEAAAPDKDVAAWINHLGRTLKTCRLYDAGNPTVVRFREDLASGLRALLERLGPLRLDVTSREFVHAQRPIPGSKAGDETLPAAFHRDGIRAITFLPGIETSELDRFVDKVLQVTGHSSGDDDLVTLLWEAGMSSITITSVPLEGDVDAGGEESDDEWQSSPVPWPAGSAATGAAAAEARPDAAPAAPAERGGDPKPGEIARSDDWRDGDRAVDPVQAFAELQRTAIDEAERLRREYAAEREASSAAEIVSLLADALAAGPTPDDRAEFARFIPRVLVESLGAGDWRTSRLALALQRECDPAWSAGEFFDGLSGESSPLTRRLVAALDQQTETDIEAFLGLAGELGGESAEWLMHVLAETRLRRVRQPLTRIIADYVHDNPERVLPWMSDSRWYVARNVIHILGWIGGDGIAAYLETATGHPESRVRREIVAALAQTRADLARPILVKLIEGSDARVFVSVMQQLAQDPDPSVSKLLLELMRDEGFDTRPEEEKRALYMTLAGRGDDVLEALEEELHGGGWFARGLDTHWRSVARCVARIGTPAARAVLERGTRASKPGIRKACELALGAMGGRDA